jgi:hypothetical protein
VRVKIIEDFEASNQVQHVPPSGKADEEGGNHVYGRQSCWSILRERQPSFYFLYKKEFLQQITTIYTVDVIT